MAKEKCPNCGHFQLKTKDYRETLSGWILALSLLGAMWTRFSAIGIFIIIAFVGVFILQWLPLPKIVKVKCENCKYEAKVKRK